MDEGSARGRSAAKAFADVPIPRPVVWLGRVTANRTGIWREALPESGRALDIGKQKGDGPGRQVQNRRRTNDVTKVTVRRVSFISCVRIHPRATLAYPLEPALVLIGDTNANRRARRPATRPYYSIQCERYASLQYGRSTSGQRHQLLPLSERRRHPVARLTGPVEQSISHENAAIFTASSRVFCNRCGGALLSHR